MPGWYCDQSDESIHDGDDMKVSDRALNRLKARVERLPEPEEIRRIRRKPGLTQAAAGELIGGGPRTFQKHETGDLLPSRAIGSALVLLDHDPKAPRVLKQRQMKTSAAAYQFSTSSGRPIDNHTNPRSPTRLRRHQRRASDRR